VRVWINSFIRIDSGPKILRSCFLTEGDSEVPGTNRMTLPQLTHGTNHVRKYRRMFV